MFAYMGIYIYPEAQAPTQMDRIRILVIGTHICGLKLKLPR